MARVWIVDGREVFRLGVAAAVALDAEVVGSSSTVAETTARVPHARVDVVVAGADLADGSGLDVARTLRTTAPTTRTLVLAHLPSKTLLLDAIDAGVRGFLPDDSRAGEIAHAVQQLSRGESLLDPMHLARLLDRLEPDPPWRAALGRLSDRQHEILELAAAGRSNREIAATIGIAEQTVKNNLSRIMDAVGIHKRAQLAALQIRR